MNNTPPDTAKPIGNVTIVKDFLPPPEKLYPFHKVMQHNGMVGVNGRSPLQSLNFFDKFWGKFLENKSITSLSKWY